jgi:prevent-host-death family protein
MTEPRLPVKTINALKARQNLGQMLEEVYYKGDQFIIERAGKPMAAVVPLSLLEELQKQTAHSPKSSQRKSKRTGKQ